MLDTVTDSPVQISVAGLVRLQQYSHGLILRSRQIRALQSGDNSSAFKGRGMEFSESRAYAAGDDIRNLDWRVMARTGEPYTKLFREERERPVFFCVDFRAPMFFATRGLYKSVLAARLAGVLAWAASAHSDRVGGLIFSDSQHHEFKPHRGKRGVLRLLRALVDQHERPTERWQADATAMSKALLRLRRVARPGSLIFILSDFRGFDPAAEEQLLQVCRHCEVVSVFVVDSIEMALPEKGRFRISDGYDEQLLDVSDQVFTEKIRQQYEQRWQAVKRSCGKAGARLIQASTDADLKTLARTVMHFSS